jgi:cytochrome c
MKIDRVVLAMVAGVAVAVAVAVAGNAAEGDADGAQLVTKYNCQTCHGLDKKLVGPAFKDIAKKYAGDKAALEKLEAKVRDGGTGVWGQIPMPPNSVPDADLKTLVEWILSLK